MELPKYNYQEMLIQMIPARGRRDSASLDASRGLPGQTKYSYQEMLIQIMLLVVCGLVFGIKCYAFGSLRCRFERKIACRKQVREMMGPRLKQITKITQK